ncbi:MAG: sel1 repeat family protein [Methanimicrococcus sp.]|nr:sel1 repeat family protein [Methanimicrococcus sp.]
MSIVYSKSEIEKLLFEAENGDSEAQYEVGLAYHEGRGVPQSFEEAAKWFRRSAEQDDFAQFCIDILLYDMGLNESANHEERAVWFRQAAEAGLGISSAGVFDPGEETIKWMTLGAAHGNVFAERNLGFTYQEGLNVPQD